MEYLEIVDEENNLTGKTEERDIIHAKGLWHREISIWIINENGEVLLQKRSPKKKQGANKWSTSCAGHIDIGEKPIQAAIRELKFVTAIEAIFTNKRAEGSKKIATARRKKFILI